MNDGILQHLRVGACAGLGAKYLSRQNSKVLGMLGSGGMARTYTEAIRAVHPIERMNVFSPPKANRERYPEEITQQLGIEVQAVPTAAQAVRGADIVALATDSLIPVMNPEWVEPGMHVTNVRSNEVNQELLAKMDVIGRLGTATMMIDHLPEDTINGSDGMFAYCAGTAEKKGRIPTAPHRGVDNPKIGTLPDLMAKRWAGRTNEQQITFLNNQGTQGLQFAAVGAKVYELATAPIAIDNHFTTWKRYGTRYWPTLHIIDKKGIIRHTRFGEGGYNEIESVLERLLEERWKNSVTPAILKEWTDCIAQW